ncbi:hypothetical protein UFOVP672_12 [uncultured Caudovirales phage]|uniref:Uncharacterized protein n=1 Tax=uncultured Caudovirales phage TaxID=2100421 RepID=A0A6J5NEL2_9CAUD|nr:hypothetical protein UFOVP672_12 [uncultured Caudovirales phage]
MGVSSYAVNFPFLDVAHIYCAVSVDDGVTYTTLDPSAYTVERYESGLGQVTVDDVMDDTAKLFIWREVPITQPTVYPRGGAFPASSHEAALDRLTMVVQEINRKVVALTEGDDGTVLWVPAAGAYYDVYTWADATARAAKVPNRAGQLGVQLDDSSVWIATGTLAGNWSLFNATAASADDELTLMFVGDGAGGGSAVATQYATSQCDAMVGLGDFNVNGAGDIDGDYSAFDSIIGEEAFYPALGDQDISGPTNWAEHVAKFDYLPGTKRYYNKVLGNGLVEIFVLHSNTEESAGIGSVSAQHAWFVARVAESTARWKIACFHKPPIGTSVTPGDYEDDMQWESLRQMDAIFCSHVNYTEWLNWQGVPLIVLGAGVTHAGAPVPGTDLGAFSHPIYLDSIRYQVARVRFNKARALVELVDTSGGDAVHFARELNDLTLEPSDLTWEILSPSTTPVSGATNFAAYCPRSMIVNEIFVGVGTTGSSDITWEVYVDGVLFDGGGTALTIAASLKYVRKACPDYAVIAAGSKIELKCSSMTLYAGWLGASLTLRGRCIQ